MTKKASRLPHPEESRLVKRMLFVTVSLLLAVTPPVSASHGLTFEGIDGPAVAIDGRTAVIGFPDADDWHGAVDVYERHGAEWIKQATLPNPTAPGSAFGHSVSVDGDTILVGAPTDDEPRGAAYVFARHTNGWMHEGTLLPPPDAGALLFGWSAAIRGNTALITSRNSSGWAPGSAFTFERTNGTWRLDAHLLPDPTSAAQFGQSAALGNDVAVVGGVGATDDTAGYARVFSRSGGTWVADATLLPPTHERSFSAAVATDDTTVVVGSGTVDAPGGSVHVFARGASSWQHDTTFTGGWSEGYGFAVAVEGDTILTGAPADSELMPYAGAINVYTKRQDGWTDRRKLIPPDAAERSWFGYSVAIDEDTAIVGADGMPRFLGQSTLEDAAPVAADDFYQTSEDVVLSVASPGVLANDVDSDGDQLTARPWWSGPEHGEVTISRDGSFLYSPDANWSGTDFFTYRLCAGWRCAEPATVWIRVLPLNDPPVAHAVHAHTDEDSSVIVRLSGSDVESVPTFDVTPTPAHGTLTGLPPELEYVPDADFNGVDSFTFRAFDGELWSEDATVTITVHPVNDPPQAGDDEASTGQYEPVVIEVLANDLDIDGDPLSIISISPPEHGEASLGEDGTIIYTPHASFKEQDSFRYVIEDPSGETSAATVTITANGCGEDGVQALDGSPAEGAATEVIDRQVEPAVGAHSYEAARVIHDANCTFIVAIEDALDHLIF